MTCKRNNLFLNAFGLMAIVLLTATVVLEPMAAPDFEELIELSDSSEKDKDTEEENKDKDQYLFSLQLGATKASTFLGSWHCVEDVPCDGYVSIIAPPPDRS